MSEQSGQNPSANGTPKRRRHALVAAIIIATVGFCGLWLGLWVGRLLHERSAAARLAAIEAAMAMPNEQNAALIYDRLVEEYAGVSMPRAFLDYATDRKTMNEPWLAEDHPELAGRIKELGLLIAELLKAGRQRQCSFPITGYPKRLLARMDRLSCMRDWARLLVRSGNNDIAEGRIEAGLEKYLALLQIAGHLRQQPVLIDNLVGNAVEALALGPIRCFVLEGPCGQVHAAAIEAALPPLKSDWDGYSSKMLEVERLWARTERRSLLKYVLSFRRDDDDLVVERVKELYLRLLADRRGTRIILALRHHKDSTGRWPETLDEIRGPVPPEAQVDPSNGGAFVYRLTEDGFTLHSRGENDIDEDGRRRSGADDWQIWPPYTRTVAQKEKADDR
jgi:hypothetical protein